VFAGRTFFRRILDILGPPEAGAALRERVVPRGPILEEPAEGIADLTRALARQRKFQRLQNLIVAGLAIGLSVAAYRLVPGWFGRPRARPDRELAFVWAFLYGNGGPDLAYSCSLLLLSAVFGVLRPRNSGRWGIAVTLHITALG
jgi:hypothetical protein